MSKFNPNVKRSLMEKLANGMADGNTVQQSAREAGFKPSYCKDHIYELVKQPAFQVIWESVMERKRQDQSGISREWIATRLQDIASKAVKDRDRISALKELNHTKGFDESTLKVIPTTPLVVLMPPVPVQAPQSIPCIPTALNTHKETPISEGEPSH